jgi:hypothetical protein
MAYTLRKGWLEKIPEYERNAKRVKLLEGEEPCVRCGKPLKPADAYWVEILIGGEILTPGDPRSGGNMSQGGWPLGETCYRKLVGSSREYRKKQGT